MMSRRSSSEAFGSFTIHGGVYRPSRLIPVRRRCAISPFVHEPIPLTGWAVMFRDQASPNWPGRSGIFLPVRPPVAESRWQAAHSISTLRLPRATRSGVTSTGKSTLTTG